MSLRILGGSVSPFVRKVRVVCIEKQLEYELEQVSPFAPPEGWREVSPLGKIPALDHDGRIVNDSSAICAYLERIAPKPALLPDDAYEMARALWFEEVADSALMPAIGPRLFLPLVLQPILMRKPVDAAAVETAEKAYVEEVQPLFAYLERELGDAEYLAGDRLSIGDIAVASVVVNLRHAGYTVDPAQTPKLAAYVSRMHERPSFAACIQEEKPIFGKSWK